MIKKYEVTAQVNMDASKYKTVIVSANTERKAKIKGIEAIKKTGAFFITNINVKEIKI